MYLFDIASVPIDLVGDIDRFEERLGGFFAARDFPMRLIAHSTAFPMHEPIAAVRASTHQTESLYIRTRALREAIDSWCHDPNPDSLHAALCDLDAQTYADLATQLHAVGFDLAACMAEGADVAQWDAFVAAVDLVFWRVPWAREAVRMYELMERRVLRAVQYILITWEPDDVSEMAIRIPLAATTRRPVRRIASLPPVIAGPYRERLTYLEPEEP